MEYKNTLGSRCDYKEKISADIKKFTLLMYMAAAIADNPLKLVMVSPFYDG
jgi:hypothetical protein